MDLGYRMGIRQRVALLEEMLAAGVHHVAFNITDSQLGLETSLQRERDIAEYRATLLPQLRQHFGRLNE